MLSKRIFETDFTTALNEELERKNLSVKDLAELTGIPASTLYKVTVGERDPRLSTIKKIVSVLEPGHDRFIAIIAARFLLDTLGSARRTSTGRPSGSGDIPQIPSRSALSPRPGRKKTGHAGSSVRRSLLPSSRRSSISRSRCSGLNSP